MERRRVGGRREDDGVERARVSGEGKGRWGEGARRTGQVFFSSLRSTLPVCLLPEGSAWPWPLPILCLVAPGHGFCYPHATPRTLVHTRADLSLAFPFNNIHLSLALFSRTYICHLPFMLEGKMDGVIKKAHMG